MSVRDRIWRSQHKRYLRPLPGRLGVGPRGRSRRLERVLTDFGSEHSFARATGSVLEHYGFAIGISAVRTATLEHAQRARTKLQAEYEQPFRVLPAVGAAHVIAEADGTMICTVASESQARETTAGVEAAESWWRRKPRTAPRPCMGPPSGA